MGKIIAYIIGILVILVIILALLVDWRLNSPGGKPKNDNEIPPIKNPVDPVKDSTEGEGQGGNMNVREIFLSKDGVSLDKVKWHQSEEFPALVEQLKSEGIHHVINRREPTSIERYEIPWNESLDAAGIKRTEE